MKTIKQFLALENKAREKGEDFIFAERVKADTGEDVFVQCLTKGFYNKILRFDDFFEDCSAGRAYTTRKALHDHYRSKINEQAGKPPANRNKRDSHLRETVSLE